MLALAVVAGLATGLMLGLLGSGGSIITLPALVYLLGVPTKPAIAMTLGSVGVTATISAIAHWRRGNLNLAVAAIFGLFGAGGTFVGSKVGLITPEAVQLLLFAAIMLAAAWRMFRPSTAEPRGSAVVRLDCSGAATMVCFDAARAGGIAALGIGVGALTGIVGVGGGFLIVPALVLLAGLPMKEAVGTSLAIVAANAFTGFAGYVGSVTVDYRLMAAFTGVAIAGSFLGTAASKRVSAATLKRGFAVFLVVVASYIILRQSIWG